MATDPKVISTGTLYGSTAMAAAAPQLTAEDYGPDGYIQDIDKPSDDCKAMMAYYNQVEAIIDGINCVRDGKEIYLPKFPKEDADDYKYRNSCGTMTNVYRDIVESLSSKPFAQEVKITKGETPEIAAIVENINGRGDHMHVFLGETFFRGINSAIQWILIDYPTVEIDPNAPPRSREDEKKLGLRPYWVQVRAKDVLQVKTQNITGVEELAYVRVWEASDRVRVFDKRTGTTVFRIYTKDAKTSKWRLSGGGVVTINVIPMVPFQTGRRKGSTWQFYPPMRDAADLQIESYQAESGLKYARTLTAYSMLGANGIQPDLDPEGKAKPVHMGPNTVLYAPPNGDGTAGEWVRLVADAAGIKILMDDVKARHEQMREIGRQPLTAQSGNVTRISAAFAATKANSAVSAWAFGLKDAAEQALKITNLWLDVTADVIEVFIFTDFPIETDDRNTVPNVLVQMRAARDLSQDTYWSEMQNQGVLSANFDVAEEAAKIALEAPDDPTEADANAALGGAKPGNVPPIKKPSPKP
jgi:hypothetical protein